MPVQLQDPPEYYYPPGGLLAFDLQLDDLVNGSVPVNGGVTLEDYAGHFKLVNYQLKQVRPHPCFKRYSLSAFLN